MRNGYLGQERYTHHGFRKYIFIETRTYYQPYKNAEPVEVIKQEWVQWRKQNNGTWKLFKKHLFSWKRVSSIILSIGPANYSIDYLGMRNTIKFSLNAFRATYGDALLWDVIKDYIQSESGDEGIKKIWKDITLQIIRKVIEQIPFPVPEVEKWADDLMMLVAEKFYDWMFSL